MESSEDARVVLLVERLSTAVNRSIRGLTYKEVGERMSMTIRQVIRVSKEATEKVRQGLPSLRGSFSPFCI